VFKEDNNTSDLPRKSSEQQEPVDTTAIWAAGPTTKTRTMKVYQMLPIPLPWSSFVHLLFLYYFDNCCTRSEIVARGVYLGSRHREKDIKRWDDAAFSCFNYKLEHTWTL
jgi:hypothetical protein